MLDFSIYSHILMFQLNYRKQNTIFPVSCLRQGKQFASQICTSKCFFLLKVYVYQHSEFKKKTWRRKSKGSSQTQNQKRRTTSATILLTYGEKLSLYLVCESEHFFFFSLFFWFFFYSVSISFLAGSIYYCVYALYLVLYWCMN